jgi:hypothetical protein
VVWTAKGIPGTSCRRCHEATKKHFCSPFTMAALCNLPVDVLAMVFSAWIDIKSLGRLDSAACLRVLRPQLMRTFASSAFMQQAMFTPRNEEGVINHLQWLIKRAVKVREWQITCELDLSIATSLVNAIGGLHVQRVRFRGMSRTVLETVLCAMFGNINNICELMIEESRRPVQHTTQPFGAFTSGLHELLLHWCYFADFSGFLEQCTNLRMLSFDACYDLDDACIERIAASCPKLEGLHLRQRDSSADLTDQALYSLAKHCSNSLLYLSLEDLQYVGDSGLQVVAQSCSNLQQLQLYDCESITEQGLIGAVSTLPDLKELVLETMYCVTDAVLAAIVERAPNLTMLSLVDCEDYYSVPGAQLLVKRLNKLQRFGIVEESDVFIPALLDAWRARVPGLQVEEGGLTVSAFAKFEIACE